MIIDLGNGKFQLKSKDGSRVLLAEGTRAEVEEAEKRALEHSVDHADAEWTTAEVNDFPDSSFLYVESGGEKDKEGKTVPRTLRHFPYKDGAGKLNLPHLRDAISRIPQSDVPKEKQETLQAHARKLLADAEKQDEADHPGLERGVFRFDLSELKPLRIQPNGWAKADGFLGRSGLLTYYRGGKPWVEYRPPEEAFNADSLDSFSGVPLTNGHPPPNPHIGGARLLDAENTREHAVGHVVGTPRQDGEMVRADILITDAAAIEDLRRGRAQLSCGYLADVDPTPGTINGQHYDAIQRNVRGNHVALVGEGRAGPAARIRLDSLQIEAVASTHGQGDRPMKTKMRLDGIDFEVECSDGAFPQAWAKSEAARADAAKVVEQIKTDAKSALDKEKARADAAETALKAKTDELAKAPEQIRQEIAARAKLNAIGQTILGEDAKVDEMDSTELMKAVVLATDPQAKLDEVSADYLAARFDAAVAYVGGKSALERGSGPRTTRADATVEPDEEEGDEDEEDEAKAKFKKASDEMAKPKPRGKRAA